MTMTCTCCSSTSFEPGFMADSGQNAQGYGRWIAGTLERGFLGGAKTMGRGKLAVEAFRCTNCGHLELFARQE
ncbi:hypothetical protein [Stackebrandtia soli]|uniref:hypothetical protein n=1 Tax=Stackebrandtia soli TaxID=1892856 RepID=UPI0039EC33D7